MTKAIVVCSLFVATLVAAAAAAPKAAGPKPDPARNPVPSWIWANQAKENQTVWFRASFDVANTSDVKNARLWMTCDNQATVYLNGSDVASNPIWQVPVTKNVRNALRNGRNVIAVQAKNENANAGFIAKLEVTLNDGKMIWLVTDADKWRVGEELEKGWEQFDHNDSGWTKPRVVTKYGGPPWDKLPREGFAGVETKATPAEDLHILPGFKAELLYSVPKATENSWVSMTTDPKGRLIVCGETGPMFRVDVVGKKPDEIKTEKIDVPLGFAQGLNWAYDSLYVTVNGGGIAGNGSGVYRVTDTDNDDKLDKVEKLFEVHMAGEHGPHATRLGPDGKIYLVAGNFSPLPEGISSTSPHHNWAEDQLLPRNPDGGGHDPHVMAPAGWVIRFDKDGKNRELLCAGMRNTYDIDFNPDGELFAYDSDMEWDTGTPWYRPTRVLLAVSGGEYGWRNGTGKWPEYSPDSLGPVVNTGLGSPVGITFGTVAKFPARYQRALFLGDWAYGNVYAAHITPEGAGYRATFEKFLYGKPFGVTDVVINPADGNMYVTIGGRGSQSGLYRISYVGDESTAKAEPVVDKAASEARAIRHKLESFHGHQDPGAVEFLWQYLGSNDRYLRYAARVALEWQNLDEWRQRALDERNPTPSINALVALIRAACVSDGQRPDKTMAFKPSPQLLREVLNSLGELPVRNLSEAQSLEALRALRLAFVRLGPPEPSDAQAVIASLDAIYPSQSSSVNREVSQLLAYLQAPSVVAKSMKLLAEASTQEDQLHYVLAVRFVKTGWTPELRRQYFTWLNVAQQKYVGGHSFGNFIIRIREDAKSTLSEAERKDLETLLKGPQANDASLAQAVAPRQFVRNWQMSDLVPVITEATYGRNFEKGKAAFAAAQCAKCHRFGNEGGATGPDLTGAGNRFSPRDVLESIIEPSKVISDQYRPTEFLTKSHQVISGQIEAEDAQTLTIRANPLSTETVKLKKTDIAKRQPARLSLMPEGLIDTFTEQEILDMVAYIRSGGSKDDKAFKK
jgi:putative heme-binding domain-containing protein